MTPGTNKCILYCHCCIVRGRKVTVRKPCLGRCGWGLSFLPSSHFPGCRQPLGFLGQRCPSVYAALLLYLCPVLDRVHPYDPTVKSSSTKTIPSQRSHLQVLGTSSSTDFWRQFCLTHSKAVVEALSARHTSGPVEQVYLTYQRKLWGMCVLSPLYRRQCCCREEEELAWSRSCSQQTKEPGCEKITFFPTEA